MRNGRWIVLAIMAPLLCTERIDAAGIRPAPVSMIEVSAGASYLDLDAEDRVSTLREASTPIHIAISGGTFGTQRSIEVYACIAGNEAMRTAGKGRTHTAARMRIRSAQGEWAELEPLPELEGRRGVLIGVLKGASATILLEVQLEMPAGQAPGRYQGVLTIEVRERY